MGASESAERLFFLDNLRYLMVVCVAIFHTAVGYSGLPEFFTELNTDPFFVGLRNFFAEFQMMVLFFLAGYFAPFSLNRRSYGSFLRAKVMKLGVPLLFGIVFLGPLMPYMGYYSQGFQGLDSTAYWDFWTSYLGSGFSRWALPSRFLVQPNYHQQHFWFLSALLQYLLFFTVAHFLWHRVKWGTLSIASRGLPRPRFVVTLGCAAALLAITKQLLPLIQQYFPNGNIAFLVHFSVWGVLNDGGVFAVGIYAHHRGWFVKNCLPDWSTVAFVAGLFVASLVGGDLLHSLGAGGVWNQLESVVRNFSGFMRDFLYLIVFIVLAGRFMNRPSEFNSTMAANSYNLYLLQYPVILAFRLLFLGWNTSAFVKFGLVLGFTLFICHLLSQHLIRPYPKLAVGVLLFFHGTFCLIATWS